MVVTFDFEAEELDFFLGFATAEGIHQTNDLLTHFSDLFLKFLFIKLNYRCRSTFGVSFFALESRYCSPGGSDGIYFTFVAVRIQIEIIKLNLILIAKKLCHILDLIIVSFSLFCNFSKTNQLFFLLGMILFLHLSLYFDTILNCHS